MHVTLQKAYLTVIKSSEIPSFFVLHWYAYVHNDPVNCVDPDGRFVFTLLINGSAGGGTGGSAGVGISIGYSKEKGISVGIVKSVSGGAQEGASLSIGISVGIDPEALEVKSGTTESLTIGGSGNIPVGAGIGADVSMDLSTGSTSYSAGISFGLGTPGEGHQYYTQTTTLTVDDMAQAIYDNMTPQGIQRQAGEKSKKGK